MKNKHTRSLVVNDYSMIIVKIATFQIKIESKIKASVEITTTNGHFGYVPLEVPYTRMHLLLSMDINWLVGILRFLIDLSHSAQSAADVDGDGDVRQ